MTEVKTELFVKASEQLEEEIKKDLEAKTPESSVASLKEDAED